MASSKFTQAVESYFTELRLVRGLGGATHERPLYVPLANLLDAVGGTLNQRCSVCRNWPTRALVIPPSASTRTGRV